MKVQVQDFNSHGSSQIGLARSRPLARALTDTELSGTSDQMRLHYQNPKLFPSSTREKHSHEMIGLASRRSTHETVLP